MVSGPVLPRFGFRNLSKVWFYEPISLIAFLNLKLFKLDVYHVQLKDLQVIQGTWQNEKEPYFLFLAP